MWLNCDMGESYGAWTMGDDAAVMPHIDMANIACGFHAGSPAIMARTIALAKQYQVKIGAHPAYPDIPGFGRRSMVFTHNEIRAILLYQIGAMNSLCQASGTRMSYVKPHGALYNDMQKQPELFESVVSSIAEFNVSHSSQLQLVTLAQLEQGWQQQLAQKYDVELLFEAFADRRYEANGQLRSRSHRDAVLTTRAEILEQSKRIAQGQAIKAVDGSEIIIIADTLCVHGDNPESIATVAAIREALNASN